MKKNSKVLSCVSRAALGLAGLCLCLLPAGVLAQEQQQGLCAEVKIVISQQLTLERVGFLATLQITDNDANNPITGFNANLTFENPTFSTNGVVNDSSSLFFVQPPTLQNVTNVSGAGVIGPGETATISWFIIPTVSAGGTTPTGVRYNVGANLGGLVNGVAIPAAAMSVFPAPITVEPDAQLQITYFQPRDVTGMDPFTGLGAPIPFTFGVLVQNVGYGPANNVVIASQQPKIVSNEQNLLLVAQLLGSRVNDSPLSNANLTVNLGTLQPGQGTKGAWDMICTLSGTFLSVAANYTHSTALGGQETSLIKSVNAYLFLHEVLDDQPGRDGIRDFLADTSGTLDALDNLIPDSLYESQGGVYPVNLLTNASVAGSGNPFQVNLTANISGWGFMRLNDPGQALRPIGSVVRSDGKVLNTNNYWTNIHYNPGTNFKDTYLNIFDYVGLGAYTYTVTYTNVPPNTNPPVTTMMFAGPATFITNGLYYVTPTTQMYFLSQDAAPVTIYDSLDGSPFAVALPFSLPAPGSYQLSFYAKDTSGNQETNHTVTLVLPGPDSLGFSSVSASAQPVFNPGGALSVRPGAVPITFAAAPNPLALNAQLDIFQGVVGWATVSNAPASPTAATSASLGIGGAHVDFYTYKLNSGAWSAERPAASPLSLSGLPAGTNTVSVLGRSQYGNYLDASNAVMVSWVVDTSAPATTVTGAPATPSLTGSAQLTVGGTGTYRWALDTLGQDYYRAPTPVANPLVLSNLAPGPQVVYVLGEGQATNNPTSVAWMINPLYGYDQSALTNVFSVAFTNIGGGPVTYSWNGLSSAGVIQPPGWYTARIAITDPLGNTNFTFALVQVGTLSGANTVLAGVARGPQNPYARGRWAVWQDQSDGHWEIYAQDVTSSNSPIVQITHGTLAQQNPRTDGRYVVWQGQQLNGSWDLFMADLSGTNGPQALTSTPGTDETSPAIDWPWVVYQARPTGNTSAPWQLFAMNLAESTNFAVSPTTQNQQSPDVQAGRVVWQDLRNPGAGEIYLCNLETAQLMRLTTNLFGKFHPAVYDHWIVWSDARNLELELYGFDLLRNREVRITNTPEDETQPYLNGEWVLCMENSLGPQTGNGRLIHLPSLAEIPVTHTPTLKAFPALADGRAVWQETPTNQAEIVSAPLPALQAVFQNANALAVTAGMAAYAQNAYGLLSLWGPSGVQAVTEYSALAPQVLSQTAYLSNGAPAGVNFSLLPGSFLWVRFNRQQVLDLGLNNSSPLNLAAGANVFGYTAFPDGYTAYQLLGQLGLSNALAVRMLDAESGRWRVAEIQNGALVGDNFPIPNVAVLMVALAQPVNQFVPQSQ